MRAGAQPTLPGRQGLHRARPAREGASAARPPAALGPRSPPGPAFPRALLGTQESAESPEAEPQAGPLTQPSPALSPPSPRRLLAPCRPLPEARSPRPHPRGGRAAARSGPRPFAWTDGPGARQPEGDGRPPRAVPGRISVFPRPFPLPGEPAGRPRRRGVPECSEHPGRTLPGAFPEAPPASRRLGGGAGARGLSPARPGGAKSSARRGQRPQGEQIPTGAARRRAALPAGRRREPGGEVGRRREGRRQAMWRAGRRTPSRAYQSPRRSDVTALHPDDLDRPTSEPVSASLTCAAAASAPPSRPLSPGNLPSPCSFHQGLRRRHGQALSIRLARGPDRRRGPLRPQGGSYGQLKAASFPAGTVREGPPLDSGARGSPFAGRYVRTPDEAVNTAFPYNVEPGDTSVRQS